MTFEVGEAAETEAHYVVTLSFRTEGDFRGTAGRDQFYIEKEGTVAIRQVLTLPRLDEQPRCNVGSPNQRDYGIPQRWRSRGRYRQRLGFRDFWHHPAYDTPCFTLNLLNQMIVAKYGFNMPCAKSRLRHLCRQARPRAGPARFTGI